MGIGKNTLIGIGVDIVVFSLGIVVSIVLTRGLGPEQRGVYVLLFTTNLLLSSVAHLSIATALSTMLAHNRYQVGEANSLALLASLAMGLLCLSITSVLFPLLSSNIFLGVPYYYLLVSLVLIPSTIYQQYWNGIMIGTNRILLLNKVNLAVNLANALLMVLAVGVFQLGVPGFLGAWTLSSLGALLLTVLLAGRLDRWRWLPGRAIVADMLGFGLRSHGQQVAHQLFLRMDVYIVKVLVGSAGVGTYSLSTSLAEKIWLPINAIHASSLSKIAQLPKHESAILTAKVMRAAILIMLSIAVPFAVVSPWLIPFVYGPEFAGAVLPLVILLAGTVGFAVLFVAQSFVLGQLERPGLLSIISWLQLAVSVPMFIALILWLGIVGAAIASSLTYLAALAMTLFIVRRESGLSLSAMLLPRKSDFTDYLRVLRPVLNRLPGMARRMRNTP